MSTDVKRLGMDEYRRKMRDLTATGESFTEMVEKHLDEEVKRMEGLDEKLGSLKHPPKHMRKKKDDLDEIFKALEEGKIQVFCLLSVEIWASQNGETPAEHGRISMHSKKRYREYERKRRFRKYQKKVEEKELNIRYASEDPSLHNRIKTLESDTEKGRR